MSNSKFYNKIWFKVSASIAMFILFVVIFTYALYLPYIYPFGNNNGCSILFLGSSSFTHGIDPEIIDRETGRKSYILATVDAPVYGRYEMLRSALGNESLDTVVIELSYNTLSKALSEYTADDRLMFFPKVLGIPGKIHALSSYFSFWDDEYDLAYAQLLYEGVQVWLKYAARFRYDSYLSARGHKPSSINKQKLKKPASALNSKELSLDFPQETLDCLEDMIAISQEAGLSVILVTTPLSQKYVWQSVGLDEYHAVLTKIAEKYNIPYYDFNLLENLGSYFDDAVSYHDKEHLSMEGAPVFSRIIGKTINDYLNNNEISYSFYSSYEECKEHSVYQSR